jgi:hypothetical protein
VRLFIVTDYDRWGYSINVVQAANETEARLLVSPHSKPDRVEVEELKLDQTEPILWCRDESPDTPYDRD